MVWKNIFNRQLARSAGACLRAPKSSQSVKSLSYRASTSLGKSKSLTALSSYHFNKQVEFALTSVRAVSNEAQSQDYDVILQGIPYQATNNDVLNFLDGINVAPEGVFIEGDFGNRTGRCYVKLESNDDIELTLKKHRQYMGSRYINVSRYRDTSLDNQSLGEKSTFAVTLRGLPFDSTEDEIREFLSGVNCVGMQINRGSCVVYLQSQEDVGLAQAKDREYIRHRYVEVFPFERSGGFSDRY